MIDIQAAREIISQMSPLPWIVLEEENGQMTIIRNPNHPIHADGLDSWGRREDAERPDARGIAYMRAEFLVALDEIARLREALIEEREKVMRAAAALGIDEQANRPAICGDCKACDGTGGFHAFCPHRDEFSERLKTAPGEERDQLIEEAECQRLREDNCNLATLNESLMEDGNALRAEAARWQAVAERECARRLCSEESGLDWETMSSGHVIHFHNRAAAALGCQPRAWLMSEERIKALDRAARFIAWADHAGHLKDDAASGDADIIQAMLAEAGQ